MAGISNLNDDANVQVTQFGDDGVGMVSLSDMSTQGDAANTTAAGGGAPDSAAIRPASERDSSREEKKMQSPHEKKSDSQDDVIDAVDPSSVSLLAAASDDNHAAATDAQPHKVGFLKRLLSLHGKDHLHVSEDGGDHAHHASDFDGLSKDKIKRAQRLLKSIFLRSNTNLNVQHPHPGLSMLPTRTFSEFDTQLRRYNSHLAIFAIIAVVTVMVLLELSYHLESTTKWYLDVLKAVLTIVSLLTVRKLYHLCSLLNDLSFYRTSVGGVVRPPFYQSLYFPQFCLESLLCLLHTPPFTGYSSEVLDATHTYTPFLSLQFNLVVAVRLYLFLRLLRDLSPVYRRRDAVLASGKLQYGIPIFDTRLALKSMFYRRPFRFLFMTASAALLIFSYIVYVLERDGQPDLFYFTNTIYFVAITMTTVGDGEKMVTTVPGRVVTVLMVLIGLLISSLLVTASISALELSYNERVSSDEAWLHHIRKQEEVCAASLIQSMWRAKITKRAERAMEGITGHNGAVVRQSAAAAGGGDVGGDGGGGDDGAVVVSMTGASHKPTRETQKLSVDVAHKLQEFRNVKIRRVTLDISTNANNVEAAMVIGVDSGVTETGAQSAKNGGAVANLGQVVRNLEESQKNILSQVHTTKTVIGQKIDDTNSRVETVNNTLNHVDKSNANMHQQQENHVSDNVNHILSQLIEAMNRQQQLILKQQETLDSNRGVMLKQQAQITSTDKMVKELHAVVMKDKRKPQWK